MTVTALAHSAVCVPDVDAAVAWYRDVLGLRVLAGPYQMEGASIAADMGELIDPPVVKAAIVGVSDDDHVLEIIGYPFQQGAPLTRALVDTGVSHIGLLCDDLPATRAELEAKGVEFLVSGIADIAGLKTTWFRDPFGVTFILLEKTKPSHPYWRQY